MTRRVFPVILALAFVLTACGGETPANAPAATLAPTPAQTEPSAPAPEPTPEPEPVSLIGTVLYEANGFRATLAGYELGEGREPREVTLSLELCNETDAPVELYVADATMGEYMIRCAGNGIKNVYGTLYFNEDYAAEPRVTVPAGETVTTQLNLVGDATATDVQFVLEITDAASTVRSERIVLPFTGVAAGTLYPDREPFFESDFFSAAYAYASPEKGLTVCLSLSNPTEHMLCVTPAQMTVNGIPVPDEFLQDYHWRILPGFKLYAEMYLADSATYYGISTFGTMVTYEISLTGTDYDTGEVLAESGQVTFSGETI